MWFDVFRPWFSPNLILFSLRSLILGLFLVLFCLSPSFVQLPVLDLLGLVVDYS